MKKKNKDGKQPEPKRYTSLLIILIIAFGFVCYINSLNNKFVYDDKDVVSQNAWIQNDRDVSVLFDHRYFLVTGEYTYRPVVTLTFLIDYLIWELDPMGYHFTNLFLHLLCSIAVFLCFRSITRSELIAFPAAMLLTVHPALGEAVNAIAFREDMLVSLFCILGIMTGTAVHKDQSMNKKVLLYGLTGLFGFLAMLSKESGMLFPVLFFLASVMQYQTRKKHSPDSPGYRIPAALIPALAALILYLPVRFVIMSNPDGPVYDYIGDSFYIAVLSTVAIMGKYILLLILPLTLRADYDIPKPSSPLTVEVLAGLVILGILFYLIYRGFKNRNYYGPGILWFFAGLSPVSNIMPIANPIAERYLYLPVIGLFVAVAEGFRHILITGSEKELSWKKIRIPAAAVFIIFIGAFCMRTVSRNEDWMDAYSLWSITVKDSPKAPRAHLNLGSILNESGDPASALKVLKKAVTLREDYADAYYNLGVVYEKLGDIQSSYEHYKKALEIKPQFEKASSNLGNLYNTMGQYQEAIKEHEKARALSPNDPVIYYNLSVALKNAGDLDASEEKCRKALELNPSFPHAINHLGTLYEARGQPEKAKELFKKTIRLDPHFYHARNSLAVLLWKQGEYNKAIKQLKQALLDAPNFGWGHLNLGVNYLETERYRQAIKEFQKAEELDPSTRQVAQSGMHLASLHLRMQQDPDNNQLVKSLAEAYFRNFKYEEAKKYFELYLERHGPDEEASDYIEECERLMKESEETEEGLSSDSLSGQDQPPEIP